MLRILFPVLASLGPSFTSFKNHYKALAVSPDASVDEMRQAYKKRAMEFHPDRQLQRERAGGVVRSESYNVAAFKEVDAAWKVLQDPAERRLYDQSLHMAKAKPARSTRDGRGTSTARQDSRRAPTEDFAWAPRYARKSTARQEPRQAPPARPDFPDFPDFERALDEDWTTLQCPGLVPTHHGNIVLVPNLQPIEVPQYAFLLAPLEMTPYTRFPNKNKYRFEFQYFPQRYLNPPAPTAAIPKNELKQVTMMHAESLRSVEVQSTLGVPAFVVEKSNYVGLQHSYRVMDGPYCGRMAGTRNILFTLNGYETGTQKEMQDWKIYFGRKRDEKLWYDATGGWIRESGPGGSGTTKGSLDVRDLRRNSHHMGEIVGQIHLSKETGIRVVVGQGGDVGLFQALAIAVDLATRPS